MRLDSGHDAEAGSQIKTGSELIPTSKISARTGTAADRRPL